MKLFRSFTTALAFAGALATAQPVYAGSNDPTDEELAGMFAFALGAIVLMGIASSKNQARERYATPPRQDRDDDIIDLQMQYGMHGQPYYTVRQLSRARVSCSDVGGSMGLIITSDGVRKSACKLTEEAWRDDPRNNRRTERDGQCELPGIWMRVPKHGGGTERLCVIPQ